MARHVVRLVAAETQTKRATSRLTANQQTEKLRLIEDQVQKTFPELGGPRIVAVYPTHETAKG
jgi:hypothetical protein